LRRFFSAFWFAIRSSLQNFRRNLGVSLAGVCTMGLILVLIGALALGTHLLTNVLKDQESRASKLKIYIQDGVSLADIVNFQHRLQVDTRVLDVSFENKDQAFQEAASKGTDIATAVTALGSNPLPASLNVDVKQLRYLVLLDAVARSDPIVDTTQPTDYNPDVTPKIQAAINIIEAVVGFVSLMLLVVSLVIIMNTIRTAVYARRTEIEIMKLVGATDWFVRWPFILEGMLGGLLAAIFSGAVVFGAYRLFVQAAQGNLLSVPFDVRYTVTLLIVLLVGGVLQHLHELGVAPDAAAVVGRGGTPPTRAPRVPRRLVVVEYLLHQDVVVPVVAEVVGVAQRAVQRGGDLLQRHRCFRAATQVGVGGTETAVGGFEDVQVAVVPAECDLDDGVQPGEADVGGHLEAPPDRWLRAPQPHLDLIDRRRPVGLLAFGRQGGRRRPAARRVRRPGTERAARVPCQLRQHLQRCEPDPARIIVSVGRRGFAGRR